MSGYIEKKNQSRLSAFEAIQTNSGYSDQIWIWLFRRKAIYHKGNVPRWTAEEEL